MKKLANFVIALYRYFFSSTLVLLFGRGCRFVPTCSDYSKEAIEKHGVKKGTLMAFKRLSKCHPLGAEGFDPVE